MRLRGLCYWRRVAQLINYKRAFRTWKEVSPLANWNSARGLRINLSSSMSSFRTAMRWRTVLAAVRKKKYWTRRQKVRIRTHKPVVAAFTKLFPEELVYFRFGSGILERSSGVSVHCTKYKDKVP